MATCETRRVVFLTVTASCVRFGGFSAVLEVGSTGLHCRWAVGSLVVRASDSRPEGLGSMLDVTKYPPSAHGVRAR
ncbi:hypothetical protein TNCV_3694731 [Trichonephila clavipes]|nr:hypothetical protein TNCV_3694731 [Trichonephila clavipes]